MTDDRTRPDLDDTTVEGLGKLSEALETVDQARAQWLDVFSRDRADLGPAHAAQIAAKDIERYGPRAQPRAAELPARTHRRGDRRRPQPLPTSRVSSRSPGISR